MSNQVRPDDIMVTVQPPSRAGETLGQEAARAWITRADALDLKTSVWAETGVASRVGPEGGTIAELTCQGSWHVVLDNTGHVAAHQGLDWNCTTCDELRRAGKLPAEIDG